MQGFINKTKRPIVNCSEIMKLFSYYFAKSKIAQKQAKINLEIILQKTMGGIKFLCYIWCQKTKKQLRVLTNGNQLKIEAVR